MNELVLAAFNPNQKRDRDGQFSDGIVDSVTDPLKLAGRIRLDPGETFGGSARVHDRAGDQSVVMARIDGPDGARLRFGVVNPSDTKAWRAENKGRTVELDAAGAAGLRDAIGKALADGKQNVSDFRAELRQAHKEGRPAERWPSPEADIASGVVKGARWGDVNWKLTREEGDDYAPGGADLGPGGAWSLSIDPAPAGADELREPFYADSASTVGNLDKAIANLMGTDSVAASLHLSGGDMAELLDVELARPGTWQLSSGEREFTADMLRDAAEFYAASGSERIPLGFGHLDSRFDGEPAFGWVSNVRYEVDGRGPVLLGDLVDLDDWVHAAAPARWPKRSIEGVAGVKFQGREYGLVLTRLALLGATPAGMPALKSLTDLRELVSAAAAEFGGEWIAASAPEATPPGVEPPSPTEGAGMYLAKYREVLAGLPDGASDDEVTAAIAAAGLVASQPEPQPAPNPTPAPVPAPEPEPQLVAASGTAAPGTIIVASSVWEETQNTIKRLAAHVDQAKRDEAEKVIASAVEQGKFTPAQKPHFAKLWVADPEGTKALIEGLTPNSALAIAASGYADLDDKEFDREFAGLFPPGSMTKGA